MHYMCIKISLLALIAAFCASLAEKGLSAACYIATLPTATGPDYENAVKEAVCTLEASGKALFPMAKASALGDFVKWLDSTTEVSVPKAVCQTLNSVYAFRSGGDGVGHGGANDGKATPDATEYLLAVCASQIIYLVDLANSTEVDVAF